MFRLYSEASVKKIACALSGLYASVATILTSGSMPHDRGSPKHTVWPGRGGTVRDKGGAHT